VTADGWPDIVIADDLNGLLILPNLGDVGPDPTPTWSPDPSFTFPPPTPTPSPTASPTPSPTPTPTPAPVPPSEPRSLVTSPNLANGIGLSWQPPLTLGSSELLGYAIYRGSSSGAETFLTRVNAGVLSFTDTAVANGTTYWYQVAAVTRDAEGPRSEEAIAQRGTAPSAPRSLTATTSKSGIALTWAAPSSDGGAAITGYRVYRGTMSGGETLLVTVAPNATGMTDTTVTKRQRYYYRVTALNVLGESVPSNEATAVGR
jgi:hypothetical protein